MLSKTLTTIPLNKDKQRTQHQSLFAKTITSWEGFWRQAPK